MCSADATLGRVWVTGTCPGRVDGVSGFFASSIGDKESCAAVQVRETAAGLDLSLSLGHGFSDVFLAMPQLGESTGRGRGSTCGLCRISRTGQMDRLCDAKIDEV